MTWAVISSGFFGLASVGFLLWYRGKYLAALESRKAYQSWVSALKDRIGRLELDNSTLRVDLEKTQLAATENLSGDKLFDALNGVLSHPHSER